MDVRHKLTLIMLLPAVLIVSGVVLCWLLLRAP